MMSYRKRVSRAGIGLLAAMVMLGGCGAAKPETGDAGSFGDAVVAAARTDNSGQISSERNSGTGDRIPSNSNENAQAAASSGNKQTVGTEQIKNEGKTNDATATVQDREGKGTGSNRAGTVAGEKSEGASDSDKSGEASENAQAGAPSGAGKSELPSGPSDHKGASSVSQKTNQETSGASSGKGAGEQGKPTASKGSDQEPPNKSGADGKSQAGGGEKPTSEGAPSSKYPQIGWNEFFDNEEQATPSDRFWDLSDARKTVQIKGFMGEVLSFDQNWFLLIPEPGAECPFDNGDETYWNKIMIVFVKDGSKLRYTNKPLKLTGRLDVGVKVDESGYKTMFRLYDAKFEEIKE
ncbi:hypothetical protein [Paenibacillus sp. 1011MAR3C5]|uniref:hypothetical protein n=1 Tax=Paenibacillus sp. 1011MAR3C5 TaxID=1675787 RepID=UPI0021761694|nr:hypothetical protein [Paenibacillus sp. 1011MAR3C5]